MSPDIRDIHYEYWTIVKGQLSCITAYICSVYKREATRDWQSIHMNIIYIAWSLLEADR